jgi:hypothetical protein
MAVDSIDVYQYHWWKKKFHQKISLKILVLKYVCNFSYSLMSIISSQNIFHMLKFTIVCESFF